MERKAVILSGGLGTRLQPFTNVIPKPLLPVGDKAVLEIQIERLKKFGFTEIVLATNYKADYIERFFGDGEKYGVKLTVSREEIPLGTAGPIKLLQDRLNDPFLVMNGDVLTLENLEDFYSFGVDQISELTIGIKKIITPYAFGNILFSGDFVTNIEEKPDFETYAMAGIYIMKPEIMQEIPDNEYFGMDKLILAMLANNKPVSKYEIKDYWLDIGRMDDYEKAQKMSDSFTS